MCCSVVALHCCSKVVTECLEGVDSVLDELGQRETVRPPGWRKLCCCCQQEVGMEGGPLWVVMEGVVAHFGWSCYDSMGYTCTRWILATVT